MSIRLVPLFLLGWAAWLVSTTRGDELKTLGGKNVSGTLTSITAADVIVETKEGGAVKTPLYQALDLVFRPIRDLGTAKYSEVRLHDESVFRASKVEFLGKTVKMTLLSGTVVTVPYDSLGLVMNDANNADLRKSWQDILAKKVKSDRLVLLSGTDLIELSGTFGDVDPKRETVYFRAEGKKDLNPLIANLHGWIFYRTEVLAETPICKVYDAWGNALAAVKVTSDGKDLALTTGYKTTFNLKVADVARIDFNMGKLFYLSDLEPMKVVERSGAGLVTKYKKDANLDGEPIVLEKTYSKGLSMHAHTELEYNLAGKYKEFKAIAGVDKRTGDQSQAVLSIFCDGERRYHETVTAKDIKNVGVNVKDVSVLKIVVSSKNFLDLHDHLSLAEAKISQ